MEEIEHLQGSDTYGYNKTFTIIAYLFPVLFFIPLLDDKLKADPLVRFHANQQAILFAIWFSLFFIASVFGSILPHELFSIFSFTVNVMLVALSLCGAYFTYNDRHERLPLVGGVQFF